MAIRLTLLGGFQVLRGGTPVRHFRGDKVRGLLAYLAVEADRPHARAALAALFWPDQPDQQALGNLSQALSRLRGALGDAAPLQASRQSVQWVLGPAVEVDVAQFAQLAGSIELADLKQAAALYAGELLAGFALADCDAFEEWLLPARERLQQQALVALERLTDGYAAAGEHTQAAETARRQLGLDAWREAAYRQLMRALAAAGDRAGALAAYARCRQALLADLGVAPDAATTALAAHIRNDSAGAAAAPFGPNHTLPAPLSTLVGREEELATLDALLRGGARLVTLLGPGGVGKTRLALAAAHTLRDTFPAGVWWVPLAGISDTGEPATYVDDLAGTILAALGTPLDARRTYADQLRDLIGERALLLTLDNCEHLPAVGPAVAALLAAAPGLRVLATSRERLGVDGEEPLLLDGLPLPDERADAAQRSAAVQLFLVRARRQVQDFGSAATTLAGVARLCRVLEGMPLGIELAAHWVGEYTPDEIAAAVRADLTFLAARDQHVPDRHRSLRAVFDYSWNLLSEIERRVLARLAVFEGGFDRAAALAVAEVRPATLAALVDKSLLRRTGSGRYSLHELLRQFAAERLAARQEDVSTRDLYARHYLDLAHQAAPELVGPQRATWVARMDAEYVHLRAALLWLRERDQIGAGLRLIGDLTYFWRARGLLRETRASVEQLLALAAAAGVGAEERALGCYAAGVLVNAQGEHALAQRWLEQSIALYQSAGNVLGVSLAGNTLGGVAYDLGDLAGAIALWEQVVETSRAINNLGEVARTLSNIGEALYHLGDLAGARRRYQAGLDLARRVGRVDIETVALSNLGNLARQTGDLAQARALQHQALTRWHELSERRQIAITLEHLAAVMVAEGAADQAARLLGAANVIRHQIGAPPAQPEQVDLDRTTAAGRTLLGDAAWDAAYQAGAALSLDAAVAAALAGEQVTS